MIRRRTFHCRAISGVRTRLLCAVGGVRVYVVDGEKVRDRIDVDFTMGGNHGRYDYIPRNEVWVESILSPRDREATIRHELRERDLMLGGMAYGPAHERANVVERRFRVSQ